MDPQVIDELLERFKKSYTTANQTQRKQWILEAGRLHVLIAEMHRRAQKAAETGADAEFYATVAAMTAVVKAAIDQK